MSSLDCSPGNLQGQRSSMSDASADAYKSDAIETRAVHGGQEPDPLTGAVMTPVFFTSTYKQDGPAVLRDGHDYSRTKNPTRTVLERNIASLEGASWGLCFASGMAAIHTLAARQARAATIENSLAFMMVSLRAGPKATAVPGPNARGSAPFLRGRRRV